MGGDEREAAEYAPEENPDYEAFVLVRAFLDELPAHGDAIAGYSRNGLRHALTEPMLRALVAGYEKLRTERSAVLARGAELEAENARMREELAALIEAQPSLQGSAFRIGWQTCRDKVNRATELLRGELAALDYANEVRKLNAEAPHRPEMFADECDCDCQPGQPCLCPERDCYCGPCRMCGENPQQPARGTACACGCGRPDDDTNMCHCPTPCPCEPDCAFCLVPNPMREPARDVADGGAE
jgi:hypothetical protein